MSLTRLQGHSARSPVPRCVAGCQRPFSQLSLSSFSNIPGRSLSNCALLLHASDLDRIFSCHLLTHNKQRRIIAHIRAESTGGPRSTMQSCAEPEQPLRRKEAMQSPGPAKGRRVSRAGQRPVPPVFCSSLPEHGREERWGGEPAMTRTLRPPSAVRAGSGCSAVCDAALGLLLLCLVRTGKGIPHQGHSRRNCGTRVLRMAEVEKPVLLSPSLEKTPPSRAIFTAPTPAAQRGPTSRSRQHVRQPLPGRHHLRVLLQVCKVLPHSDGTIVLGSTERENTTQRHCCWTCAQPRGREAGLYSYKLQN